MAVSTKADMALIQGAKDVGTSMRGADVSGLDKVIKAGTDLAVGALEKIAEREQKKVDAWDAFTKTANDVELSSGALGEVLYNDTVDFAQKAKDDYLAALKNGDQKGMMAAKKAMQSRSQFTQQHKAFITDLAKLQKEGDLSGAMKGPELDFMTAVLGGNYTVETNDKGEMVFNVNGVKKTNAEFEDLHILKNYEVGKTLGELNAKVVKEPTFNRDNVKNTLIQVIPKTVKEFRAALHDDLGGGANFPQLLNEDNSLEDEIKSALGDAGWDLYAGEDGEMDPNEKALFIEAITDHENPNFDLETSRMIMAEKMSNIVENKFNTHQEDLAKAAKAKNQKEIADKAAEFAQKKALKQMEIDAGDRRNVNTRKDLILTQTLNKFGDLEKLRKGTDKDGTYSVVERALQENNATNNEILQKITKNEIAFFKQFVDPTKDVRHLNRKELKQNYPEIELGEIDTEGAYPEQGYYQIIETKDEKGNVISQEPILISGGEGRAGYELDINSMRGLINFGAYGIEGASMPYSQGSLNTKKKD